MKKLALFTAFAGLTLVNAAPPSHWTKSAQDEAGSDRGYPACSRTVTDRCIQLYERGIASRTNLALNERLGMNHEMTAMGGPYEAPMPRSSYSPAASSSDDYPPCSRTVRDRCIQLYERGVRRR